MFKLRNLGLLLASLVTAVAIAGAASLIALDFVGVEGLAGAWSSLTDWLSSNGAATKPARTTAIG